MGDAHRYLVLPSPSAARNPHNFGGITLLNSYNLGILRLHGNCTFLHPGIVRVYSRVKCGKVRNHVPYRQKNVFMRSAAYDSHA